MSYENQLASVSIQYSELLRQLTYPAPGGRGICFVNKVVKGHKYWFLQNTVGSRKTQYSLGRDSFELREKIEKEKQLWEKFKPENSARMRLVAMLVAGGVSSLGNREARVFEVLERAGVFLLGGVLVGSQAFILYGNMLGVRWPKAALFTQDIDLASDKYVQIGIGSVPVSLEKALIDAGMGFFPVPALNPRNPSTSFKIRNEELTVDLITPMIGKPREIPVYLPSLKASAAPVRFLEYLLEDVQPAVVISRSGILVNVPSPARYAIHKIVISQRRPASDHLKRKKDMDQAEMLLEVLLDQRPGDLLLAIDALKKMPGKFKQGLEKGVEALSEPVCTSFRDLLISEDFI